jgi:integrase
VDLEGRACLVARNISAAQLVETPKGGRARAVPLATPAVEVLQRQAAREDYVAADDLVFPDRFGGHLHDSALRRRFAAACDAIGLRRVRMHGLRHGAASHLARQGSAAEVMGFLGHSELSTTSRYMGTRFSPDFLKRLDAGFGHRTPTRSPRSDGRRGE